MGKTKEKITFENALIKLENIVTSLENGNVTLEESIKLYEEGMQLSGICSRALDDAKQRIEIIKTENFEENSIKSDKIVEI